MENQPTTLMEAVVFFSDESKCERLLFEIRWPDGVVTCPHCKLDKVHYLPNQKRWKCSTPHKRRQFSIRTGTIFEESRLPLSKWFVAFWLITAAKNGISSYEVHRALGVTQKTAWFMLHRARETTKTRRRRLEGVVDVDEAFIGGRYGNMHADVRRRRPEKAIVMGLLQRDGRVQTTVIPDRNRETLHREIKSTVAPGSRIFTDDLKSYGGGKTSDIQATHQTIYCQTATGRLNKARALNGWPALPFFLSAPARARTLSMPCARSSSCPSTHLV